MRRVTRLASLLLLSFAVACSNDGPTECCSSGEPALRIVNGERVGSSEVQSMKILVHITHGPEAPTRAALGFHVAKAALEAGHPVTIFLAGDAVQLMRPATRDRLAGLGTGELRELLDALVAGGASFYLSGGSSQARGL